MKPRPGRKDTTPQAARREQLRKTDKALARLEAELKAKLKRQSGT